jgi:hypothetical protein
MKRLQIEIAIRFKRLLDIAKRLLYTFTKLGNPLDRKAAVHKQEQKPICQKKKNHYGG